MMSKWTQDFAQPKWKVTEVTCYTLKPLMLETHGKQLNLYRSLQSFLGPFKMTKLSWKVIKIKMIVASSFQICFPEIHKSSISHHLRALCFTDVAFCVSQVVSQSTVVKHSPQFTQCVKTQGTPVVHIKIAGINGCSFPLKSLFS